MLLAKFLEQTVSEGDFELIDANGRHWRFGDGKRPHIVVRINDKRLHWRLLLNPKLALGEAYMDGTLTIEQGTITDLLDVASRNLAAIEQHPAQRYMVTASRIFRKLQQYNPVGRAQQNVAHHYDLSDDLYDIFLDSDRQYSCAYFRDGDNLEDAQTSKKRHLAAKLLLDRPGLKVLDIGSGWGGLGLYLAQHGAADVTGVTLSVEQHKISQQRARDMGLSDRVRFQLRDYRHETGKYDRIISVGMFEHVGAGHFQEFFDKIRDLLTDDGICILHSIGRHQPPGNTNAWLRKYIFPGGYTPALSEVFTAVEKTGLWVTDVEVLRLHYAETLRLWNERFQANRQRAAKLYDEQFCRMWEFYLVGCEYAFRQMGQMVFQMQLTKHQDTAPLTRDYITDWDRGAVGDPRMTAAAE